ncbi:MAG: pentapeptide repeat-containing protein [Planctomycetaceae bacterium]
MSAANLHGAKFWSSNFRNAKLGTADLTDVRFYRCDLRGADLSDALLKGIDFGKSKYDETTILPKLTDAQRRTLKWAGKGPGPAIREPRRKKPREVAVPGSLEFPGMLETLVGLVDSGRLDRGLKMLKAERFQLFAEVLPDSVVGVVKSQTDPDLVYACRIDSAGGFSCCTQNLNVCGGLRGSVCKHLVVLTLGLSQGGELDPATACNWIAATASGDGALDKDRMSEVFLKYKGAEAGEIDWRPTETVPEDFYAF